MVLPFDPSWVGWWDLMRRFSERSLTRYSSPRRGPLGHGGSDLSLWPLGHGVSNPSWSHACEIPNRGDRATPGCGALQVSSAAARLPSPRAKRLDPGFPRSPAVIGHPGDSVPGASDSNPWQGYQIDVLARASFHKATRTSSWRGDQEHPKSFRVVAHEAATPHHGRPPGGR